MNYEIAFLKSLFLTIIVESIVLFILFKTLYKKDGIPLKRIILLGILASLATLPYLWFIFPLFLKIKLWYTLVAELTAIFAETLIVWGVLRVTLKKSMVISLVCNGVSYSFGIIFNII